MGSSWIDRLGSDVVDREYVLPIPNGTIVLLRAIGGLLRTSEVAKPAERDDILFSSHAFQSVLLDALQQADDGSPQAGLS